MSDRGSVGRCVAREHLVALLDDGLAAQDREDVEAHIERCPACQDALDRLIDSDLGPRPEVSPPDPDAELAHFLHQAKTEGPVGSQPIRGWSRPNALRSDQVGEDRPGDSATDLPSIAGFQLLREVGRGGMGVVYEAIDLALGRRVALKVVPRSTVRSPALIERFRREARAVARLHHAHIVPVFGFGEDPGHLFFSMQLINGESLNGPIGRGGLSGLRPAGCSTAGSAGSNSGLRGEAPYRAAAQVGLQVALALDHAHQQGIIHRDIKPSNILIEPDGTAWVADFGLAKTLDPDDDGDDLTQTGDLLGTLRYMAPERFAGRSNAAGDLYGLGATLYELILSRPLHPSADRADLIEGILRDEPPRPRTIDPRLPVDLETILLRAVAKDPSARYPSAAALAGDLQRFLTGEPILARRIGRWERSWRWSRRNPALAGLVAAVVLAVAVGLSLAGWGWQRASTDAERAGVAHLKAQRVSAESMLDRGLNLLDRGQTTAGRHWVAASLATGYLPNPASEVARLNLQMWGAASPRLMRLLGGVAWGDYLLFDPKANHLSVFEGESGAVRRFSIADGGEGPRSRVDPDQPDLGDHRLVVAADRQSAWIITPAGFFGFLPQPASTPGDKGKPRWRPSRQVELGGELHPAVDRSAVAVVIQGQVRVFDAPTGQALGPPLPILLPGHPVLALAPGGGRLTTVGPQGGQIWDVPTGRLLADAPQIGPATERLLCDRWGHLVGVQRDSGLESETLLGGWSVRFWDAQGNLQGEPYHESGPSPVLRWIVFSPNGETLGLVNRQGRPLLFNSRLGQRSGGLVADLGTVEQIQFSPDGALLATGTESGRVQLCDVATGRAVGPALDHGGAVHALGFADDGLSLAIALGNNQVAVWRLPDQVMPFRDDRPPTASRRLRGDAVFSADAAHALVLGSGLDQTQILATADGGVTPVRPAQWPHLARLAASADGQRWATASSDPFSVACGVDLLDAQGGVVRHLREPANWQFALAFAPNGQTLATAGNGGRVLRFDAATGRVAGLPLRTQRAVRSLAFSPDGRTLAVGTGPSIPAGLTRQLQLWDLVAGTLRRTLDVTESVAGLSYAPDGRSLLVRSGEAVQETLTCSYRLHDAETLRPLGEPLAGSVAHPDPVAFLADGRLLTGGPGGLWEWDLALGKPSRLVVPLTEPLREIRLDRSAQWLAVLTQDGLVRLHDPATYRQLGPTLGAVPGLLRVAFPPDGRSLVGIDAHKAVRSWPLPSRGGPDNTAHPGGDPSHSDPEIGLTIRTGVTLDHNTGALRLLSAQEWQARATTARWQPEPTGPATSRRAHRERATLAEQAGDAFAALWHLQRIDAPIDNVVGQLRQAHALACLDQWDEACRTMDRLRATAPTQAIRDGLLGRTIDSRSAPGCRLALQTLDEILRSNPNDSATRRRRAEILAELGEIPASVRDAVTALTIDPDLSWASQAADRSARLRQWAHAAAILHAGDQRGEGLTPTLAFRGAIASLAADDPAGYRESCIRMIQQAHAASAETCDEWAEMAAYACCLGPEAGVDLDEPIRLIRRLLTQQKHHLFTSILGGLLVRAGRDDEALTVLTQGIAADHGARYFSDSVFEAIASRRMGRVGFENASASLPLEKSQGLWEDAERFVLQRQVERSSSRRPSVGLTGR